MNQKIKSDIIANVTKLEDGLIDRRTLKELLRDIRDLIPNEFLIKEVANFAAHPKERDRGLVFEFAKKIARDFYAGNVKIQTTPLFDMTGLFKALTGSLRYLKIPFNKKALRKNKDKIAKELIEIMTEIPFTVTQQGDFVKRIELITDFVESKKAPYRFLYH